MFNGKGCHEIRSFTIGGGCTKVVEACKWGQETINSFHINLRKIKSVTFNPRRNGGWKNVLQNTGLLIEL